VSCACHLINLFFEFYLKQTAPDPVLHRHTDQRYSTFVELFKTTKTKQPRERINVLSLFSGVGGDLLVLKRLEIDIGTVVCVEHDHFASAVCRANNEKDVGRYYNVTTFEELEKRLEEIMIEKGRELF
jgi:hypothetical protein